VTDLLYVEAAGRRFAIEHAWIGPADAPRTLVFLHEGLGSVAMWRDYPARLCEAAHARGFVFSRPGYGHSTPREPAERWPLDYLQRQARDVLPAVLAAAGIGQPAWLFGHSDGASIALLHAAWFPRRTAGAIVLAPHTFVEDVSITGIEATRAAYATSGLRARLARYHADPDSPFYGWSDAWLDPGFRAWNIEAEMRLLGVPVLAIQGEGDEYGTMAQLDRLATASPHVALAKLAACGHTPQRDQPDAVTALTVGFMARHPHPPGDGVAGRT